MAKTKPAAMAALGVNDLENFIVASTPGGIEAQEAREQQKAVAAQRLPKDGTAIGGKKLRHPKLDDRQVWESLGFKFGDDYDDIFVNVTFPAGWQLKPTDHSMWNDLLDDKGRKRAAMFYKGAFYDRSSHIGLTCRYSSGVDYSTEEPRSVVVKDGDKIIHTIGAQRVVKWKEDRAKAEEDYKFNGSLCDAARAWLKEHFPNYEDPTAYWD